MSDTLQKIPSFNEVMNKTSSNGKIPSFDDVMGEEVKKKETPSESSSTLSASASVGGMFGSRGTPQLPSSSGLVGVDPSKYETNLSAQEESKFKVWLDKEYEQGHIQKGDYEFYKENGYGYNYDFRAAFKAGEKPKINKEDGQWHWSDIGKKPDHPTFSKESKYNNVDGHVGGTWDGERFIPPPQSPLDAEGIFNFNKGKKKEPLLANNRTVDVNSIIEGVTLGNIEPEELSAAYNDVFGKATVEKIINEFAPDLGTEGWGRETFKKEWKWNELAKRIKTKNRINAKVNKDTYLKLVDDEIANAYRNLKTVQTVTGVSTISGAGAGIATSETPLPVIDPNNPFSYSDAIRQIQASDKVVNMNGNEVEGAKERLLAALEEKAKSLTVEQGVDKEVSEIPENKIANAIARSNMSRESGESIPISEFAKNDKTNEEHFKLGLSYIKKVQPGQYKNVIDVINAEKQIPDDDFRTISEVGQKIYNEQIFYNAATNPELIDKETSLDYTTHSDKKAQIAALIGERAKKKYGITRKQYTEKEIHELAYGVKNKKIVQELADEEQLPGYDAIPKYGPIEAGVRGFTQPFFGILSTLQSIGESPVETYIRSKKLDTGSAQKVPDEKGNLSPVLPSDRGNIFYDAINGGAQFAAQVVLTRGAGGVITKAIAADARIALTPALKYGVTNTAGTAVSTFMQTWGDSYADYLAKTGDYATARLGATVDAGFTSVWELWLPESKIADRALSPLRKQLSTDIIDLVKKGGDPATLAKKGRGYIEKAITGVSNIVGQEVLEEVGTQATDWLTEYVFSPQTIKDRDLGKEIIETVKATAIQTIIPAIFGGGGSAFNKDFVQNGFHSAAINFNEYKQTLDKQLNDNIINQDDYNSAIKLLSTHRESIAAAPKQDINGKAVEGQKRLDYAFEETKIKGYKENAANAVGVAKKMLDIKIKQSEDIQTAIVMPEKVEEPTPQTKTETVDDNERFKPQPQEAQRAAIVEQPEGAAENVVPSTLKDVESTEKALEEMDDNDYSDLYDKVDAGNLPANKVNTRSTRDISEAYHKAKEDGSNPELVKAVEEAIAPQPQSKPADVVPSVVKNDGKKYDSLLQRFKDVQSGKITDANVISALGEEILADKSITDALPKEWLTSKNKAASNGYWFMSSAANRGELNTQLEGLIKKSEESSPQQKQPADVVPSALKEIPKELSGEITVSNTGFGGNREHTSGKVNLEDLKVLDNGIETAKNTLATDKKFKPSKEPVVVGIDIVTGEKQLLDGYHRYVLKDGKGEVDAKFIPMRDGNIIKFQDITPQQTTPAEQRVAETKVEDTRTTEIKKATKPALSLDMGGITNDMMVLHPEAVKIKNEKRRIENEFDNLQEIVNCIYG